ncbi:hypothetical protein B6I21_07685 [candidate division KSB1 bacterium 4572_119]|nr:MAG: hypothetical protein B6I21_07685 [candidate division KSB1 bacterium 4572_119]
MDTPYFKDTNMKILVIDEDEFLAENLCQFLKFNNNIQARYVSSNKEAIQLISQNQFDLILTDIQITNSIHDNWLLQIGDINPGQKMIIISSYPIPKEIELCEKLNIIGYFEKPFDN